MRWEQVGRLAMLAVMAALAYLYLSAGVRMFSTWRQAHHAEAAVGVMEAEHRRLTGQHNLLSDPETVEGEARRLGMARDGERQYVLSGLPGD
ncbi:MAG TPA: septum formation initiator family protein [Myxococcales bacterium]|nr:septum formation initiator family protein [Myxococcales bacterium]